LNQAVERTLNYQNQINNELSKMSIAKNNAEGLVNKANIDKSKISNEANSYINNLTFINKSNIAQETNKLVLKLAYVSDLVSTLSLTDSDIPK